jgi:hypothetical protein
MIFKKMKEYFVEQDCEVVENEKKYKLQAKFSAYENMKIKVKIEETEENAYCIRIEKCSGNKINFISLFNEIKTYLTESNIIL